MVNSLDFQARRSLVQLFGSAVAALEQPDCASPWCPRTPGNPPEAGAGPGLQAAALPGPGSQLTVTSRGPSTLEVL